MKPAFLEESEQAPFVRRINVDLAVLIRDKGTEFTKACAGKYKMANPGFVDCVLQRVNVCQYQGEIFTPFS